jgi:hypothetical protein
MALTVFATAYSTQKGAGTSNLGRPRPKYDSEVNTTKITFLPPERRYSIELLTRPTKIDTVAGNFTFATLLEPLSLYLVPVDSRAMRPLATNMDTM